MFDTGVPFAHLPGVLDAEDLDFLVRSCRQQLETEHVPCFSLIDRLNSPTYRKIEAAVAELAGQSVYYLNDFYIYTDSSFKTSWHIDTELFSFDRAINAWILLSPDEVDDPLGFIKDLNSGPDDFFHSVTVDGDEMAFSEYHHRKTLSRSLDEVESSQVHTPHIDRGDILVIDPSRFHKTNLSSPKHVVAIKFILEGANGFLSPNQVHPILWPEVKTFNGLVKGADSWDEVLDRTRQALQTEEGKATLSSGFFPDKFEMYLERVRSL